MKVAFVTWKFPALSNTFILNEIVEVLRRGFEVAIYSIDKSDDQVVHQDVERFALLERTWFLQDFMPDAAKCTQEFGSYSADWLRDRVNSFRPVARHMRRTGVDVVHGCFANNSATVAMVTARLAGLPFTFECHAFDLFVDLLYGDEKIAEARRVFSISEYNREHLVMKLGCDPGKVVIRRVPILEEFCDTIDSGERIPGLIASVARLHATKGYDLALDAFATVAAVVPWARYVIVGEGELRPQLDDVNDDLALLDTIVLRDIVAARLTLPSLPPNFREILANGEADLRRWQQLQGVIQNTIAVAGAVAEGVSTMAALVMKYGKFLV